ncbi:DUF742 domain-containing protein [Streptomyces zhihengii]
MNPYWEDEGYAEDGAGSMVRPYTITRGRTAPERDDFTLITVLTTREEPLDERGCRCAPAGSSPSTGRSSPAAGGPPRSPRSRPASTSRSR